MAYDRMKILRGLVNNWKSFPHLENPEWIEYGDLNILIGGNSHGKSNYLNALRSVFFGPPDYNNIGRDILAIDFNDPEKPIQLFFDVLIEDCHHLIRIEDSFSGLKKNYQNNLVDSRTIGRLFPLGVNRPIADWGRNPAFNDDEALNLSLAQKRWSEIREDFRSFFKVALSATPPQRQNLSDVSDERDVRLNEIGNGYIAVLYFMLELKKQPSKCKVFLFEEPENHMHPGLQADFITYLKYLIVSHQFQFFITTHSSVFIDSTVIGGVNSKVLYVKKENQRSQVVSLSGELKNGVQLVYEHLGYKPSQLLLSNCIIWVEGPSDRIYINKWISDRNSDIHEFKHYSIMFYGGSLLAHLEYDSRGSMSFIELSKLNVNAAIVMDSDKVSEESKGGKKFLTKLTIAQNIENAGGYSWITNGKEIENYVEKELFERNVKLIHKRAKYSLTSGKYTSRTKLNKKKYIDKVEVAQRIVENSGNRVLESDVETASELDAKIYGLIAWIKAKNNLR